MTLSFNLLNSRMIISEQPQHVNSNSPYSKVQPTKNGELFYSKRLLKDAQLRILESKKILEDTRRLKKQLENSNFF